MALLIVGATGEIGKSVLELSTTLNIPINAGSRTPSKAAESTATTHPNITWTKLDLTDPSSFAPALSGVEKVFLYHGPNIDKFVHESKLAGVKLIVFVSSLWTTSTSTPNFFGDTHSADEKLIKDSGIPYAFLRGGEYCRNEVRIAGQIKSGHVFASHIDAKGYRIHERDIAEVAFAALTRPELIGSTPRLINYEKVSTRDCVRIIAEKLGKEVKVTELSEEEAAEGFLKMGFPEPVYETLFVYKRGLESGTEPFERSEDIETILGKKPRSFTEWVDENIHYFE